ncbi:MAG TPA: tRNA-uridine aminocarboxypropyltransferase [Ideonella sp.]|uniref:tRNA-uridine aminocarboxypropyltransferase n=1 Tax=Ideonella sp. TaxID=1929293 RepID=UPI002C0BC89E|nr:tRNA-uridine aminocarboxypropyltransferase [Ideonella sp.]HSI51507.1 tRNA-uridine aminocarboxypropyltransferase [Ideonella sp.]
MAPRPACPHCHRPLRGCLCSFARPVANKLPLLVLQHPLEVGHPKGSVPLLQLSLARCRVSTGEQFDPAALTDWLGPPGHSLLLYPELAPGLPTAAAAPSGTMPGQLVVIDGTWRKSLKMLLLNPGLQALPRMALRSPPPSRYGSLRQAPQAEQRSTLEACCQALGQLEQAPETYLALLAAFDDFVQQRSRPATAG